MILSNVGIQAALNSADLIIAPEPAPRRPTEYQGGSCPYDTCSVNLRLGSQISIPKPGKPITLDFRKPRAAWFLPEIFETISIDNGGYALAPNKFTLGQTLEHINLPIREGRPCFAARIEGRSTFARVGLLVHFTAPTIHVGFEGTITLEMINLAEYPISLFPGMEICQLIIEEVNSTPFTNPSVYHAQSTPTGR
jgi:dCTP deaminase